MEAWKIGQKERFPTIPDIIAYTDYSHTKVHSILDAKYVDDVKKQIDASILYQIAFYLKDYKKKVGYIILPKIKNSEDYTIESLHQKPLEIRVRHIDVEKTLEWIFDKSEQNTTKIRKMLLKKFPISIT